MVKILKRLIFGLGIVGAVVFAAAVYYVANPAPANLDLPAPLQAIIEPWDVAAIEPQNADYLSLSQAFQSQRYRSFCGPASVATVLRAYGHGEADQTTLFPSLAFKVDVFFSGISLAELEELAKANGLQAEKVYADTITIDEFREMLSANTASPGDYALINYDRQVLNQDGGGHISPVAAYDSSADAFLVLDQAAYKYPFTWVPTNMLFRAVHTRADNHFRGVLIISDFAETH